MGEAKDRLPSVARTERARDFGTLLKGLRRRLSRRRTGWIVAGVLLVTGIAATFWIPQTALEPVTMNDGEKGYPSAAPPTFGRERVLRGRTDSAGRRVVEALPVSHVDLSDPALLKRNRFGEGIATRKEVIRYRSLMGTDSEGRDIARILAVSARNYVVPILLAVAFATGAGILLGFAASDFLGRSAVAQGIRILADSLVEVLESVPKYVFVLFLAVILARVPWAGSFKDIRWFPIGTFTWYFFYWVAVAIGVLAIPKVAKPIVERVNALCKQEFVDAARASGLSAWSILFKHILWYNTRLMFVTLAVAIAAEVVIVEVAVSILSAQANIKVETYKPGTPTLGRILANERGLIAFASSWENWWVWFFPLTCFMAWTLGLYALAGSLKKAYTQSAEKRDMMDIG